MRQLHIAASVFLFALLIPIFGYAAPCSVTVEGHQLTDTDCDGYVDAGDVTLSVQIDNCSSVPNGDCDEAISNCDINKDGKVDDSEDAAGYQADFNGDGKGDACQDSDGDGIMDYLDPERNMCDLSAPTCVDSDNDGVYDPFDVCKFGYDPLQEDADNDGEGDVCDNCWLTYNADQEDKDGNGVGDVCPAGQGPKPNTDPVPSGSPNAPDPIASNPLQASGSGCSFLMRSSPAPALAFLGLISTLLLAIYRKNW